MSLLSSVFRNKESLSKEVKKKEQKEEEGPCTSYSHLEEDNEHEGYLDHQILSNYLFEFKSQPIAFTKTLAFPQFIQWKEEKRPCTKREIKGNRFLLSTFDGSTTARAWARKLEAFFLIHLVVEREAVEVAALHLEGEANAWWFSHLSHTRVTYFSEFTQGLIRNFDGEIS